MITETTYLAATTAAQALMKTVNPDLVPDGKWGRYTQRTYERLPPAIRSQTDRVVATVAPGVNPAMLRAFREGLRSLDVKAIGSAIGDSSFSLSSVTRVAPHKGVIAPDAARRSQMIGLITMIAGKEGVPVQAALDFARVESNYDSGATSPTGYAGLFQIGPAAVTDVYRSNPTGLDFVPYSKKANWWVLRDMFDPVQNTTVGLRYYKIVARYMGLSLSEAPKIYLGYNLGSGVARKLLRGQPLNADEKALVDAQGTRKSPEAYAAFMMNKFA